MVPTSFNKTALGLSAWFCALAATALLLFASAAEVIPPVPPNHFNDYAGVISRPVVQELNSKLESFEKETSSQIVVAIYPKMQSDSSVQDFTVRVAQSWHAGLAGKRNGAVLFLFVQDRQMFLQVGYGLEGAIPDATAKQITEFEIKPRLQARDYDGGLRAGVNAIMAAARGEYKGTGRTVAQSRRGPGGFPIVFWIFIIILILLFLSTRRRRGGRVYGGRGWSGWDGGGWGGTWGGGGWSGGSSGGGWSGGGGSGGSFSSGGGDFGGGGAGSSW